MDWLQTLDATVFYWINNLGSNRFFDVLLPLFRERWFWAPLYLFVAAFAFQNFPSKKAVFFLFGLVLTVGLADFTSSTLIKKNVQRLRPCREPALQEQVIQRVSCGGGYSFTSSHAANHFAAAVFIGLALGRLAPWIRPALVCWASSIAYAQVYVGVHYPGDVICGGVLGAFLGWWTAATWRRRGWLP